MAIENMNDLDVSLLKSNIKKKENTVSNCRITTENQAVNVCIEDKIYVFSKNDVRNLLQTLYME